MQYTKQTVLFQRVLVFEEALDGPDSQESIRAQASAVCRRVTGDEDFVATTLPEVMLAPQREALFYATEGRSIIPRDGSRRAPRVVYLMLGSCESELQPQAVKNIRRRGEVDFEGVLELGASLEKDCFVEGEGEAQSLIPVDDTPATVRPVIRFAGEQNEFFSEVEDLAVLIATKGTRPAGPEPPLIFEKPFRWGVSTRRGAVVAHLSDADRTNAAVLGEGVLMWPAAERQYGRYGVIELLQTPQEDSAKVTLSAGSVKGRRGRLIAEVLATRDSPHAGDRFRRIFPQRPNVGELIELGNGICFSGNTNWVGCQPEDGREIDWLNPRALYRCHLQTVRLLFIPKR